MLEGINILISCVGKFWSMLFDLPFIGSVTWGWFILACGLMAVMIEFLFAKLK